MEPIGVMYTELDGWVVSQGENTADHLTYDEMLGLFAALTMPEKRPCLQWMKPNESLTIK